MGLLTREEEKRFSKERKFLTAESSEGTEDDTRRPSIPAQTTARGPVQVEVVRRREKPERRVTKRRRVVSDDEGDLALKRDESPPPVGREGSSGVLIKLPAEALAEPLKEGMEIVSPNSLSSERTQTAGSEGIPHPKTSEELVKELTLSDEVLEQIVAQDSVVPLLKYLDGKREKYAISKEVGFNVEMIRNRTQLKRAFAVKREWNFATDLARERAAILATECAAVKMTFQEREVQL
ncbi:hypothetical protein AXG93_1422s1000 [Marchantia polymorpha subsp. ruderalis]|uniref:Uncharacterized protein n=1 Tax=Marchantia polymorpha subsp. ruderalis TaxID=1480154 RepID=A0A176WEW1_MARPO|nr:hypothetical protein AXG93_1422s1000 [Marchantia polymorpha subsp. ruderalis]